MCTTFLVNETLPNGKVGFKNFRTAICTGKTFHIKCDLSACSGNLLIFLVWLRRLWIAFQTNSRPALKQCFQSNRYARQTYENLPKVCPHKRRDLHFDLGR